MNAALLHDIAGFVLILAAVLLTAGIIRPFIVVWWSQHKTRTKVLAVYGSIVLVSAIVFFVTIDPTKDGRKDQGAPKEMPPAMPE